MAKAENMDLPEATLIEKIEAFCERNAMTPTDFGRLALNDTALMTTLRAGRELRHRTRRRVEDFMAQVAAE